ncbi:GH36-type glycosyl hydrolase domain-containing protein [Paralcaligenes ureilyticus]|uniref:Cellobiose phosphorylase n=1 Tax=Paralcaligenes ureilyticus TaxID=627131 RepID=A0A4R3MA57_9BURK|nr:glycosyl hydrolase family 65 protein [Paralcaligenes ureilyticus]TCT10096.1 cellobiose phosphorylase [Paralcaligenes ureilyticus]
MTVHQPNSPYTHLLSNGRYHVMVTGGGGGYSLWNGLAVNRWREDETRDQWGAFFYIRDTESNHLWSAGHQPTRQSADRYAVDFSAGRAVFRRTDGDVETRSDIVVSQDDDVELRRLSITNRSTQRKTLELTSYLEVVLSQPATDSAHQAFNKLFVETEIIADDQTVLGRRRPRAVGESTPLMFHTLKAHTPVKGRISFETDRLRFIGRGRSVACPQALDAGQNLSGSAGPVLDPVAAIRCRVSIDPGKTAVLDFATGVGQTREACLQLAGKYRDKSRTDRVLAEASNYETSVQSALHATPVQAQWYQHLASHIIYPSASWRADAGTLCRNQLGQPGLWPYAISGDLPIALLRVTRSAGLELVRQLVQAHTYWSRHGLAVDLVIVGEDGAGQTAPLKDQIAQLVDAAGQAGQLDQRGGIYVRASSQINDKGLILLQSVARIVINDSDGALAQQIVLHTEAMRGHTKRPGRVPVAAPLVGAASSSPAVALPERELVFDNGLGGFTTDGCEYVIRTTQDAMTPAPWVNVLANSSFGSLITESGSAHTWSENSHEFRLTPWSNDPVSDSNTEAYYVRDEESGRFWSPTPSPAGGSAPYISRHGRGYSVFEHSEDGIASELCVYVAIDAPIKFARLRLCNMSGRARRLSVTGYVEWVLGDESAKTRMHVITHTDPASGAVLAHNAYNTGFPGRTAFFAADDAGQGSATGDRASFLGADGDLRHPAAMGQPALDGRVGPALDPCAAIRLPFELGRGEQREIVFRLGAEKNAQAALDLIQDSRGAACARQALDAVERYWVDTLGVVQVNTPDPSLNLLANGWLVYQILACRLWGRTAFYQASGAFGFRDQLQDVMALVHAAPAQVREHLLLSASRQFPEGDVQHWWHPPAGQGIRTHCSDDYLWLPLVACRYVQVTGDIKVLDEPVYFLDGSPLGADQESCYELPKQSNQQASLYEHCVRAIKHGLRFGSHGLPLMGAGDWNDGMNLVGAKGKGESVWLGFFLCSVLTKFSALAQSHNDPEFARQCIAESARLRTAIEACSWDGQWYRRAWFDDGSVLGSRENAECRIDSIAQSWSVLSGAADLARARQAMDAVDQQLVRRDAALIQLLDPPFDRFEPNPGYIKGYLRGVRENGGQYTHAAVWSAMAFAALGDADRAWQLFTMINPVNHAGSAAAIATYKTEPYVLASDVYSLAPHVGRGGWTWYTGSAGWMYQFITESLLGLRVDADQLHFAPCVPDSWDSFELVYRYRQTTYRMTVLMHSKEGDAMMTLDGIAQPGSAIKLADDKQTHRLEVRI